MPPCPAQEGGKRFYLLRMRGVLSQLPCHPPLFPNVGSEWHGSFGGPQEGAEGWEADLLGLSTPQPGYHLSRGNTAPRVLGARPFYMGLRASAQGVTRHSSHRVNGSGWEPS